MKKVTVQIDRMISICNGAGVEKQINRRDSIVRMSANFPSDAATIAYIEMRAAPTTSSFIALITCGVSFWQCPLKSMRSAVAPS